MEDKTIASGTKRKPSEESFTSHCVHVTQKKGDTHTHTHKYEALPIKTNGASQGAAQSWSSAATHEQAEPPEPVQPCIGSGAICLLIY